MCKTADYGTCRRINSQTRRISQFDHVLKDRNNLRRDSLFLENGGLKERMYNARQNKRNKK